MTDREVMQMALEDLETWNEDHNFEGTEATCAALRTALAQPEFADAEPEPERVMETIKKALDRIDAAPVAKNESGRITWLVNDWPQNCLLYTTPPQREWVGLTDDEIIDTANMAPFDTMVSAEDYIYIISRAIEAKLKDKNNG